MPSLRKKVTKYFRQLSFIAERENQINCDSKVSEGTFLSKYLAGSWKPPDTIPKIQSGKKPADLPCLDVDYFHILEKSVKAAYTGPNEGLNGVRRFRSHLSAGPEIDFIDKQDIHDKTSLSGYNVHDQKNDDKNEKNNNKSRPECEDHFVSDLKHHGGLKIDLDKKNTLLSASNEAADSIANIQNWHNPNEDVYGISISLYEKNCINGEHMGDPIADCFGIIARENSCVMAIADGVNWGNGARLAARCAVQGSIDYLNSAIFGTQHSNTTTDVFISLVRSFWEAHDYIMEMNGALTTLTVVVILPLSKSNKSAVCCANVGDSLGYVYSKTHGVREITQGSHDVNSMRDMRDALGALGPVNGSNQPELSNFTLSFTTAEDGDIVFLTSDGLSDNFDPVVGKFAEAVGIRQNEQPSSSQSIFKVQSSTSNIIRTVKSQPLPAKTHNKSSTVGAQVQKSPSVKGEITVESMISSTVSKNTTSKKPLYMRSKTVIEPRQRLVTNNDISPRLLLITGKQRHQLTLLRILDLITYGIDGAMRTSTTAKQLCQILIDFATFITSAKRKLLEQRELYYRSVMDKDGQIRELQYNKQQQKINRKRMTHEKTFTTLPGKLDHASIVAFTIKYNKMTLEEPTCK